MESGWTAKWIPDNEVQPEYIFQIASRSIAVNIQRKVDI